MIKIYSLLLINILVSILYPNDLFSINTSRPGTFNPTTTVQTNNYQFELGFNSSSNSKYFWMLGRTGVSKNSEIQFSISEYEVSLGYMYGNIEIKENSEASIIISSTYNAVNSFNNQTSFYAPFFIKISKNIFLNTHLGIQFHNDHNFTLSNTSYAFALSNVLNDRIIWFTELYGEIFQSLCDECYINYFDCGFTYTTYNNLQFDFSIGTVLNTAKGMEAFENDFIELGFSFYFPS